MIKFSLFILALASGGLLYAQKNTGEAEKSVQRTIRQAFEALSDRDSAAFRAACTTDALFIEYGKEWNTDTLVQKAIVENKATDFRRINTLDFISTKVNGDIAWAAYYNKADITSNGRSISIYWIESVVLIRKNDLWKIDQLHSTLIKRE